MSQMPSISSLLLVLHWTQSLYVPVVSRSLVIPSHVPTHCSCISMPYLGWMKTQQRWMRYLCSNQRTGGPKPEAVEIGDPSCVRQILSYLLACSINVINHCHYPICWVMWLFDKEDQSVGERMRLLCYTVHRLISAYNFQVHMYTYTLIFGRGYFFNKCMYIYVSYMYIYIYMYHPCIYIYMYHTFIYIYICIHIYIYIYIYMYAHMFTQLCSCTNVPVFMHVYRNSCIYIYIYIYACMHVGSFRYVCDR